MNIDKNSGLYWQQPAISEQAILFPLYKYSKRLKSGHFCIPISDDNYRPKSGQKCPDFGHSTKLGWLPIKGVINFFIHKTI